MNKKIGILLLFFICLISINFISSEIQINKKTVSQFTIPSLNKPALFDIEIKNLGEKDTFNIYTFVGVRLEPSTNFTIDKNEVKKLRLMAYPEIKSKSSPDYYSFRYKIKGEDSGVTEDELVIIIVELQDAFSLKIDPINPDSTKANIEFENLAGYKFDNLKLSLTSSLFNEELELNINPFEKKELEINLDENKIKSLLAGQYIANVVISIENQTGQTSTTVNFQEKESIETNENNKGFFVNTYSIEKKNTGNLKATVNVVIEKNLITSLFTKLSIAPIRTELKGLKINYIYQEELEPNESFNLIVKTNWWILFLVILAVLMLIYLFNNYLRNKLILKKSVQYVHTKGGEFALRVSIYVKARDYVEKIRIFDRLPPMFKVFDKIGLTMPDKIEEASRRLEWNLSSLSRGESRIFSYIIYSKIGVMGKFELPEAGAAYEFKGHMKDASSNRVMYSH